MKKSHNLNQAASYDVIVIGGGPSGSTTATLLSQKGYRVLVLEKNKFPRFSIGESLMPETYWTFKRLGMLEKLKASHFPKKYSVQFISSSGRESQPFYFFETNPHESSQTWQVLRSEFDHMMLKNAAEHGAEVREECLVKEVLFDGDRACGVLASPANGKNGMDEAIRAQVIVDASGRHSFLSRRLHLWVKDPMLNQISIFSYFENGIRDSGIDAGVTRAVKIRGNQGWFWYIPLPYNQVSVGVVAPPTVLYNGRPRDPERIFMEEIELCSWIKSRLAPARRIMDVRVLSEFSYRSRRIAGNGWVLVGDAFGFLDPVYASGVFLALKSGEFAADAIDEAFRSNDFSAACLGSFGPELVAGMENIRKLIYVFYNPDFSFARFVREHPEHRNNLIDLLIGDVFKEEAQAIFREIAQHTRLPEPIQLEVS